MKGTCLALVLSLAWAVCASAEEPVTFGDSRLKQAVEEELWITDPTATDMLGMTSLTACGAQISDLTGLQYAANMESLNLRDNEISDLSALSGMSNLVTLDVSMNRLSDLSPLGGMASLVSLDVHDNARLSDISPVGTMPKLQTLIARYDSISGIEPLSGLAELSYVDLCQNEISNVSALTGLTCLSYLDLRGNVLAQQACDVDIPQIIRNNPGIAISYHRCGPRQILISSTGGGCVLSPGEGEFWYDKGETISLKAEADPCYVFVGWTGAVTSASNPVRYAVASDQHIRANFASVLTELYVDSDAPGDPKPADAEIGDPQENGTPDHPFDTIQEALDVGGDGATIFVDRGTYRERINLLGKEIHLVACDPCDPHAGPCVTIEGVGAGPVVQIPEGGGSRCGLTGFVITRGSGETAGGIYCAYSSPRLTHCLIVGNRCRGDEGAAAYFHDSQAVLTSCTIADNYAGTEGAGLTLEDSDVVVLNSILWNNQPNEIRLIDASDPSIQYSDVQGWWPDLGNTYLDPLFARPGRWVHSEDPNEAPGADDPCAVWVDGDYHLMSQEGRRDPISMDWVKDAVTSPCIDAGDPDSPAGQEPLPNGSRINLGAYAGTSQASLSPNGGQR